MKKVIRNCIMFIIVCINIQLIGFSETFATEFDRPSTYSTGKIFNTGIEYYGHYYRQKSTALIFYNLILSAYSKNRCEEKIDDLRRTDMIFNVVTRLNSNDKNIEILNECYNKYLNCPIVNNRIACCQFCNKLRQNHIQAFLIGAKLTFDALEDKNGREFVIYILEKDNFEKEYWVANFDNPLRMPLKDFVEMNYEITYYFEPADGLDFIF